MSIVQQSLGQNIADKLGLQRRIRQDTGLQFKFAGKWVSSQEVYDGFKGIQYFVQQFESEVLNQK